MTPIIKKLNFPELNENIIKIEAEKLETEFRKFSLKLFLEKVEYVHGEKRAIYMVSQNDIAFNHINSIKDTIKGMGYEKIEVSDKFLKTSGSFTIEGENGRKKIIVFGNSNGITKIFIGLEYNRLEVLIWTLREIF